MKPNSARRPSLGLSLLTIGFCTDLAGEARLRAAGVERIWRRGDGVQSLDDALYEFRGRAGALAITDDLRIFGLSRREILAKVSEITRDRPGHPAIKIVDIRQPEKDAYQLADQALGALHAAAPMRNHRTARRRGRQGGLAKAAMAELARGIRCAADIVQRLCDHPALTWDDCAAILGPPFSKSTLQRICQR